MMKQAIKMMSTLLVCWILQIILSFAYNGASYKFGLKNPLASHWWHLRDHGDQGTVGEAIIRDFLCSSSFPGNFNRNL